MDSPPAPGAAELEDEVAEPPRAPMDERPAKEGGDDPAPHAPEPRRSRSRGARPAADDEAVSEAAPSDEAPRGHDGESEAAESGELHASSEAAGEPSAEEPPELDDEELLRAVSALVFASPEPLSAARLAQLAGRATQARVRAALERVRERLAATGLPIELREIAGGFVFLTAPDAGPMVERLAERRKQERLSGAALETLAIVAYRQPVTKAEVEAIRGVQAGPILRTLVDRGLVRVAGRADQPGYPLQYGTTREFLERFGLATLDDLPRDGELARD